MANEKIWDCICMGSSVNDLIIRTSALKQMTLQSEIEKDSYLCIPYSFKVPIERIKSVSGGSALNTACTLSRLGLKVVALSKVGNDQYGNHQIRTLERYNVDVSGIIKTEEVETGISIILSPTWGDRDRSILVYHGASDTLTPEEINSDKIKSLIEQSKWIDITSFTSEISLKAIEEAIKIARDAGTKLMIAPSITMMSFSKDKTLEIVKKSDYLAINKDEGEYLVGKTKSYELLNHLYKIINKENNILKEETVISITDGSRGSYARYRDDVFFCENYKVEVKNTTGAGDAFSGGFLYALLKHKPIDEILKIASAVAAHKIQYFGVRKGLPTEDELYRFMKEHEGEACVYKHYWKEI
ncbi:MAG: carbohydrate kinase family protein [Candidatus Helarchaeota archaeon]